MLGSMLYIYIKFIYTHTSVPTSPIDIEKGFIHTEYFIQ